MCIDLLPHALSAQSLKFWPFVDLRNCVDKNHPPTLTASRPISPIWRLRASAVLSNCSLKRDIRERYTGRCCHLPNASANAVGRRAEQCVGTRQVAVRSVVDEPAGVGDTAKFGGGREAGQPPAETVNVEKNSRTAGTARSHHKRHLQSPPTTETAFVLSLARFNRTQSRSH